MTKVSIMRCPDYNAERVFDAVSRAVDLVGGIGSVVKPGMKVLLKPNLLSARTPEEAVCTHPEVVRAVVRLVKGAGGIPLIGDSPGGYGANIDEVFERSGMLGVSKSEGVELVKFTASKSVDGIPFARHIFECDSIISIPKMKTHGITLITAAVKNMYGAVVGLYKAERHSISPKEEDFAKVIAKVYAIARPHLTILDAITAMEGDGPSAGVPRNLNFIMAGKDAVAIDAVAARIVGLTPLEVLVTREAYERELGEADLEKIEIAGDNVDSFVTTNFKLPATAFYKMIPDGVVKMIAALMRFKPVIDELVCTRCRLCKLTCPVSAIEVEKESCSIDYKKCVKCLCCQEVCPYRAIGIKRSLLAKLMWG